MPEDNDLKRELDGLEMVHQQCKTQTGVKDEDLEKARQEGVGSDQIGDYVLCVAKKTGLLTEDNRVNKDIIKERFGKRDPQVVDDILNNCINDEEVTKTEVLKIISCIMETTKGSKKPQ
ncbi:unnamed protein product [Diabrotica balteata]|uniref:Uncharacterized protein n=1 Tax=Diabrotica balteata TaxID=107213 RepID=A0A9N9T1V2_DIABA|nr:unnamed protein product [Diabrotica balteata]